MSDIAQVNAVAYAAQHGLRLVEQLGSGIHGIVHVAEREGKSQQSAVKAFNSVVFYERERGVYERLREREITDMLGFHVPQFIRADDHLHVIEMTIVTPPFLLDFAGAHLDARPEFPQEAWSEWEASKRDQFGNRWRTVQSVMDTLEEFGIYLVDVSPTNIRFAD